MAVARPGVGVRAGFEHRDQIVRDAAGNVISSRLICKHLNIEFPELHSIPAPPACASSDCIKMYKRELDRWLNSYKRELDFFELLCLYDSARMKYVYKHKHDDIPEKYRTGEDPSASTVGVLKEIAKLKLKR